MPKILFEVQSSKYKTLRIPKKHRKCCCWFHHRQFSNNLLSLSRLIRVLLLEHIVGSNTHWKRVVFFSLRRVWSPSKHTCCSFNSIHNLVKTKIRSINTRGKNISIHNWLYFGWCFTFCTLACIRIFLYYQWKMGNARLVSASVRLFLFCVFLCTIIKRRRCVDQLTQYCWRCCHSK